MPNIVVAYNQDFSLAQKQRLESLGQVTYYDSVPSNAAEYLRRVKGADIICSGTAGLRDVYKDLKDVYISVPFVSVAFLDVAVLRHNNVALSNSPGANRHAVSEWVMAMMILLMRDFPRAINTQKTFRNDGGLPPITPGLAGRAVTILGHGHVGRLVAELATAFGMQVTFFKRNDDLYQTVHDADVVVDTLSSNPSTQKLLNHKFFKSMKHGGYFITITRAEIVDEDAMLQALDSGQLAGVATDCGSILVGDTDDPLYQKLQSHPKVLATPHVAYSSQMSTQIGNDIMIDNVEAWLQGKLQNLQT